jgi:hypothetical protein
MDRRLWLYVGAGLSAFMALCQSVISVSPAAAAYFQAPPSLLENRWKLFLVGEGAALIPVAFALYALSGAGTIRRLPLLRSVLVTVSTLFLLRGLLILVPLLQVLGVLEGKVLIQGAASSLVFLAAGIAYAAGTALNWEYMRPRR